MASKEPESSADEIPFSTSGAPGFYWSLMRRYRRRVIAMTVLMILFAQLAVVQASFIAIVVDGFDDDAKAGNFQKAFETGWKFVFPESWEPPTKKIKGDEGFAAMLYVVGTAFVIVGILAAGLFFAKEYVAQRLIVRMLVDVRVALFQHLTRQSVAYFHARRSGDLLSRVTNDVNLVQGSLRSLYETALQQPWIVAVAFSVAFFAAPFLFLWSIPLFALLVLPVIQQGQKIFRHSRKRQRKLGIITESLQELFSGIRIVKAFGMEEHESDGFRERNREFERSYMKVRRARITARALQELAFNVIVGGLLVVGVWLLNEGEVSKGDFFAFCGAFVWAYEPVKKSSKAWNQIQESRPGIERILEVLRYQPRIVDRPDAVPFPGAFQWLRLEQVSFVYGLEELEDGSQAERVPAIHDVDLEVRAGEVIALVGSSGGGKSTLVDLIARFHDVSEGRIAIDGTDIRDFVYRTYLDSIAIVSQDPFLFNTTIRENIGYGRQGATDDEIVEAAKVANAHEFIEQQPDGYNTNIGERGAKLSGGQRQRLTIARAVLKNAPILILDEATSALDTEAEREVQLGIDNLLKERTSFVIAHRLSTITGADRIVVLDGGRIVEIGSHEELLERKGRYFELYTSQNRNDR